MNAADLLDSKLLPLPHLHHSLSKRYQIHIEIIVVSDKLYKPPATTIKMLGRDDIQAEVFEEASKALGIAKKRSIDSEAISKDSK